MKTLGQPPEVYVNRCVKNTCSLASLGETSLHQFSIEVIAELGGNSVHCGPFRNGLFNCIISFKGTDNKRECYRRNSPIISVGQTVAPPKTNSSDKACACLDPFADSRINHRARIDSVIVIDGPYFPETVFMNSVDGNCIIDNIGSSINTHSCL